MVFSDEELYEAVQINLQKANSYVSSHGGDIKLLGVKDGTVYIELMGTCQGCAMSLMTTKMVVQKKLRELIHPELNVVNVDGTEENKLPAEYYSEEEEEVEEIEQVSLWDKVKNTFIHKQEEKK